MQPNTLMYPTEQPAARASRMTLLLGMISFATVAFLYCLFRLLSFFVMPFLFFDLLFIGFPIGAFVGARYFQVSLRDFSRSLVILNLVMLLSLGFCLLCKRADYLRATLYDLKTAT